MTINTLQIRPDANSPWTAIPVVLRQTTSYDELADKPTINGVTIVGDKILGDFVEFLSDEDVLAIWNSIT